MTGTFFRSLPRFIGKHRLARLILKPVINSNKDLLVKGRYGITYCLPNLVENVGFDIYVDGAFEPDTITYILKRLPPQAHWLDIGANIGSISIPVSKQRPETSCIGVEASPRVFSYLQKNQQLNAVQNLIMVNKAMANADNQTVAFYSPEEKFGKGSMASVFTKNAELVQTITLDTLFEQSQWAKVDFIKIDVEGFECLVFQGGKELLSASDAPDI